MEYDGAAVQKTDTWHYSGYGGTATITSPDGSTVTEEFNDSSMPTWSAGLIYKTTQADGSVFERLWQQNIPHGMTPQPGYGFTTRTGVNTYVKTEFISIKDAAGNLIKTAIKDFTYDKNGNVMEVVEYDWVDYSSIPRDAGGKPEGIPGGLTPKRVIVNTYYNPTPDASDTATDDPDVYHRWSSPNIKRSVESGETRSDFSAGSVLSRAESFYDNPSRP
jgi:hypothetical protein